MAITKKQKYYTQNLVYHIGNIKLINHIINLLIHCNNILNSLARTASPEMFSKFLDVLIDTYNVKWISVYFS